MVKDIIVSYKVDQNHYRKLFMERIESDEPREQLQYSYLMKFLSENHENIPTIDKIMSVFQSLTTENVPSYMPVFNYLGLYVDVFDRLDLMSAEIASDNVVLVYLETPGEGAIAIGSPDPESSSVTDCIMNMFIHKLTMNPQLSGIVNLQFELDTYNSLASMGEGFNFNAGNFYNFITSGDRILKIFID